jgi:Acetyltransferase (GNAT) domain
VSPFDIVAYEPGNREEYLRLLRETRGGVGLSSDEFDWWFGGNPTPPRLMAVAKENGNVLGVASHTPYRMRIGGSERLVTFSVHAGTEPAARGRGIFRELELRNEDEARAAGAVAVLAFASSSTQWIFLGPLGWQEVGRLHVWARPLRPRAVLGRRAPASTESLTRFGAETDKAYQAAAARYGNHVVRDSEYLDWRYGASPWGYRSFGLRRGGDVVGFATVREKRQRGRLISVLGDLVAPPGSFRDTRTLLRRAIAETSPESVALFALPARDRAQRRAFASLGFVPTWIKLHFVGKALADGFTLPLDPAAWHFSLGDTDFF